MQFTKKARKNLAGGAAGGANQFLAHVVEAALRGGHPMMPGIGRIVAHVLLMAAVQVGNPIAVFIHVKAHDFASSPGGFGLQRPHSF